MNDTLTIGIVGCGAHAQIAHLPFFAKHPRCKILAVCDADVRKIDHLSGKYQIPYKYQDIQDMLANEEINALIIAAPNLFHSAMAISALKYGKHVFCENPVALTKNEAQEIIDTVHSTGKKCALTMNNRLRQDVDTLKKFIHEGELGDIYYVKTGWLIGSDEWILSRNRMDQMQSGGGAFLSLGISLLDIALYFLKNKKPSTIFASIHTKEQGTDVEDTALCMINFNDRTLLTIEVGWSLLFEQDFLYCNVFGKKGAALLNPLRIQKELHNDLFNVTPTIAHQNLYRESYERQADAFIRYILDDISLPITLEEGLLITRICESFYESARSQKLVDI
jgi:predicted dehydrogenase